MKNCLFTNYTVRCSLALIIGVSAFAYVGFAQKTGGIAPGSKPSYANAGDPVLQKPNADFDGDLITDFSIVRGESSGLRSGAAAFRAQSVREKMRILSELSKADKSNNLGVDPGATLVWYVNNSQTGSTTIAGFGTAATDFIVPEDFDGDGMDDFAVWRGLGATTGAFFIFESLTMTVRQEMFGQTNDNPTVVGDYDGDGKADPAVFRCPPLGGGDGQCFFYFRGSDANPGGDITFVPWGFGETFDFFPNPGDFDGDGKYDFCIQRTDPGNPGQAQFVLLRSSDSGVEYIPWGGPNDFIVPGDFDGDGKSDFMVRRGGTDPLQWFLLERDGGGTGANPILWGSPGDIMTPGDYDGDGKQDVAIWRPDPDPANNFFYVWRSSDLLLQTFEWGSVNDFPVAGWNIN